MSTQYSEAGKGSQQRPTDYQKYAAQYDKIFGTKKHSATLTPTKADGEKNLAKIGENK